MMYGLYGCCMMYGLYGGCMGCMGCMAIHWRGTMRERCMGAHTAEKLYALLYACLLYGPGHRGRARPPRRCCAAATTSVDLIIIVVERMATAARA